MAGAGPCLAIPLKAAIQELPPATQAEAEATKQLLDIQTQLREKQITPEDAAAASEAIRNGLKSQTGELERQAKLEEELLAKEKELQAYTERSVGAEAQVASELERQKAEKEEIARLTQEIEDNGGMVLPPKEFEALGESIEEIIPPVEELVDVIATGPDSVAGALDRASGASANFKERASADIKVVTNDFRESFDIFEEYGKSATSNVENAIDEFARTGKLSVGDFAASVLSDLAAITAKAAILGALFGNKQYGGDGSGGLIGSFIGAFTGSGTSVPSADGGGFTGMGSRSGGIDGKGGFPAILHPNETVLDHTKGQGMGGGTVNLSQTVIIKETLPAGIGARMVKESVAASQAALTQINQRGGNRRKALGLG